VELSPNRMLRYLLKCEFRQARLRLQGKMLHPATDDSHDAVIGAALQLHGAIPMFPHYGHRYPLAPSDAHLVPFGSVTLPVPSGAM
jgi:hypothetical protein